MRKFPLAVAMLVLLLCGAVALADQMTFDGIHATCTIPDDYIVLTRQNLSVHPEWLAAHDTTEEDMLADWDARGVLTQAWTPASDVCMEITAVKDERAQQYYDINEQDEDTRRIFRQSHTSGAYYGSEYRYESAEWKKSTQYGRFLALKYTRTVDGDTVRGYQRRTVRNGYTITLDYQVFGRALKNADLTAIDGILKTWRFTQVLPKPADVVSKVVITAMPPDETNTATFTVTGKGEAGLHLTGVLMRMSSNDRVLVETTIGKDGKIKLPVTLPGEGVWLMSCTVDNAGTVTEELVFNTTTYQKNLLAVTFDQPLPTVLTEDKLVISGKTLPNTTVQCLVEGVFNKSVKTGNAGTFKFTVDTSAEGDYNIALVFQKKNLNSRRFATVANRTLTEEDIRAHARAQAVKPSYATLVEKIKSYSGKTLHYNLYITDILKSGDEWVIFTALSSTKTGYKNTLIVTSDQEPGVSIGSQHEAYGVCEGTYLVDDPDGGEKYYPCMRLLFFDN